METEYYGFSKSGGTYKIINKINGKQYFGSAKCFKDRHYQHNYLLTKNNHGNIHLQSAFNKHGSKNFLFEVIEVIQNPNKSIEENKEERLRKEQILIDFHWDNCKNCYNTEKYSRTTREGKKSKNPEETSKKMSLTSKTYHNQPHIKELTSKRFKELWKNNEWRKEQIEKKNIENISKKAKEEWIKLKLNPVKFEAYRNLKSKQGKLNWILGKCVPPSDETKQKISKANKGKHNSPNTEFKTGQSFEEKFGIEKAKEIKQKNSISHTGIKHTEKAKKRMSFVQKNKKPCFAKNLLTEEILEFSSITNASKELNILRSNIQYALKNKNKTKGFSFSFNKEDFIKIQHLHS